MSRVKAGFNNPEQPASQSGTPDILSRVKASASGSVSSPLPGGLPNSGGLQGGLQNGGLQGGLQSGGLQGGLQSSSANSDIAIKSGLSNSKETAGIPAPKSYLEPTKKLAPSSFAPVSDENQPKRVGIYRVPTGSEDKK